MAKARLDETELLHIRYVINSLQIHPFVLIKSEMLLEEWER